MTRFKFVGTLGVIAVLSASIGHAQEKKIAMTPVTYDGLKQEVLKQRGKVLVVDFWFSGCVPCIKTGFPHMVEMHKKFADQGLTVITVSVDDPEIEGAVDLANKLLNDKKLPFRHVHLRDPDWQKRLQFGGVPCYYVFDRGGRWVRFGGDATGKLTVNYDELEKTVADMLKAK